MTVFTRMRRCAVLLPSICLAACGSSSDAARDGGSTSGFDAGHPVDAGEVDSGLAADSGSAATVDGGNHDSGGDASVTTVAHAALPQVVDLGGTVLTAPKVQLIAYAEDPTAPDIVAMLAELTKTTTWSTQTGEYGVGPLTVLPAIQIAGTPPATLDDSTGTVSPFEQTLVTNTTGANPPWGAADPSTIYLFLLPLGTNVTSGGGNCCSSYLGYHYAVTAGAVSIPYAVACDCPSYQGDPITVLQGVTTTVSHELVEGATDPLPFSNPAYTQEDDSDIMWTFATGGELADMCQYNFDSNYLPPGSTYMIQRTWSNAAAAAGTNPCVPVPATGPFFESMAVLPDTITIGSAATNGTLSSKGVLIPLGMSRTIDVQLYSAAATSGPWTVKAYDLAAYLGTSAAESTVSLDKTSGSNGDVLHLTITPKTADATWGGEGFVLESDLNGQQNITIGAVAN